MIKIKDHVYVLYTNRIKLGEIIEIETRERISSNGQILKITKYKVKFPEDSAVQTGTFSAHRVKNTKLEVAYTWLKAQGLNPSEVIQGFMQLQKEEEDKDETSKKGYP